MLGVQPVRQLEQRVRRVHDRPREVVTGLQRLQRARCRARVGTLRSSSANTQCTGMPSLRKRRHRVEAAAAGGAHLREHLARRARLAAPAPLPASAPQASVSSTVTVGPTSGTAQRTARSRAAASAMIQPGLAVAEQPDARRGRPAAATRGSAPPPARRGASTSIVDGVARSPGYVPRDWPIPRLSSASTATPEQRAERGEHLELLARLRAGAVHHHDGGERPEPGGSVSVAAIDADAHLALAQRHARVALRAARLRPGDAVDGVTASVPSPEVLPSARADGRQLASSPWMSPDGQLDEPRREAPSAWTTATAVAVALAVETERGQHARSRRA